MFKDDKRESIGRRTIRGIIIFTLLLAIVVSLSVTYGFSALSRRHYHEDARDYAGIISHVINGDTVQGYIETGEKDLYYDNTVVFLESFRDEVGLADISVFVPDGDSLFVYTDGVTEATNSEKELFGDQRMLLALNEDREAPPEELLKNVQEAINGFVGDAQQFDDITMLAFRYNGK